MKLYDISVPIASDMHVYEGDPPFQIRPIAQIEKGAPLNLTSLAMGSHTGTHIDAPYHLLPEGARVDQLPLDIFYGPALVRQLRSDRAITCTDLEKAHIPGDTKRLLLKTRNSHLWEKKGFQRDFAYLDPESANWLVQRGIKLVGIDYLSVEAFGSQKFPTHLTLLKGGVLILEGLNLIAIRPGHYTLVCFPLMIAGSDGAPTRAILIDEDR
ncbi:MAG: cyclase family protein [Chloroflexi bacterium]|nr:cyclase family protein [Chloroflexota bacterium]